MPLQQLVAAVRSQRDELRRLLSEQQALARVDGLTGLINPRGFESTEDDEKQLVPSYAFGGRVPVASLFLDLDIMYSVEASGNRRHHGESTAHAIRQRAAVGYQVVAWLALTAGAGLRQRWDTDGDFELGPTVFGGVQVF